MIESRRPRIIRRLSGALALVGAGVATQIPCPAWAQTQTETRDTVIISAAPLDPGVAIDRIPAAAVALSEDDLSRTGRADLLGALDSRIAGVSLDHAQGNPFQPNVLYRGFEASPLPGDPQGLAVYLDGSRFNQSFGDTVDWDLLPDVAIRRVDLVAANPAYGLNALGGALNVQLKNAFSNDGITGEASAGSFGRRQIAVEAAGQTAGKSGSFGAYIAASALDEDGWRDFSPSRLRQGYADLGWKGDIAEVHINYLTADNDLTGNGASPVQLLAQDRSAVFTYPDRTQNRFQRIGLAGDARLNANWSLRLRAFHGWLDRHTLNGDAAEAGPCDADDTLVCDEDDVVLTDTSGAPVPNFITGSPYAAEFPDYAEGGPYAYLNHTETRTSSWSASGQATRTGSLFGIPQRIAVGASVDLATTRFAAGTTIGGLSLDRGWFGPGIEIDQPEADITPVGVQVSNTYWGLFASDTADLTSTLSLTLTGRANIAHVKLRDQLGTALDGDHTFRRFNPGAGLTWRFAPNASAYGGYSEASRAPAPAELSCADPDAPCSLTNFFVADPPLHQVVAHTFEAGFRGQGALAEGLSYNWHFGGYRTDVDDDIQMVASSTAGRAYFTNIGKTRRQGIEAGLSAQTNRLSVFADYAWTDATYRTSFDLGAGANPAFADEDDIMTVVSGDHRPGIPAHVLKVGADYSLTSALSIGVDASASSGRYYAGDEANLNSKTDSYVLVGLHALQRFGKHFEVFANIQNLFDTDYETFGAYSPVDEVPVLGLPILDDPRSVSPGAPRAAYIGLRYRQ